MGKTIRHDKTPEAQQVWEAVDQAVERLPEWVKDKLSDGRGIPCS